MLVYAVINFNNMNEFNKGNRQWSWFYWRTLLNVSVSGFCIAQLLLHWLCNFFLTFIFHFFSSSSFHGLLKSNRNSHWMLSVPLTGTELLCRVILLLWPCNTGNVRLASKNRLLHLAEPSCRNAAIDCRVNIRCSFFAVVVEITRQVFHFIPVNQEVVYIHNSLEVCRKQLIVNACIYSLQKQLNKVVGGKHRAQVLELNQWTLESGAQDSFRKYQKVHRFWISTLILFTAFPIDKDCPHPYYTKIIAKEVNN